MGNSNGKRSNKAGCAAAFKPTSWKGKQQQPMGAPPAYEAVVGQGTGQPPLANNTIASSIIRASAHLEDSVRNSSIVGIVRRASERIDHFSTRSPSKKSAKGAHGAAPSLPSGAFRLDDFVLAETVGSGSFGKVIVTRHKQTARTLALYFIMDFVNGGEMFTILRRVGRFSVSASQFYAAEVLLALQYLHEDKNILYRDLKPENILIDRTGHIKLADFGFAKRVDPRDKAWTLCGTPEYLSPEMILNKGHGKEVDYWAYGVLVFEMLAGQPPFSGDNHYAMYETIIRGEYEFHGDYFSAEAKDLIKGLLQVDRTRRLGNLKNGAADIRNHPWFASMDWSALERQRVKPPYVPKVATESDATNFSAFDSVTALEIAPEADAAIDAHFVGFESVSPRFLKAAAVALVSISANDNSNNTHSVSMAAKPPKSRDHCAAAAKKDSLARALAYKKLATINASTTPNEAY
eukprot:Opistho-2@496